MGFQEFTLSNGHDEVMLHVDVETGAICGLYAYADNKIQYYTERTDAERSVTKAWQPKENKLYVHCPSSRRKWAVEKLLRECDFVLVGGEEDNEPLVKMLLRYRLESDAY